MDDKPASIVVNKNGNVIEKSYYTNGKLHRFNKPAFIKYWKDKILCERYYAYGKLHRENGPAEILYTIDGYIRERNYYFNDEKIDYSESVIRYNDRLHKASCKKRKLIDYFS